jgi:hypothetical protein
MKSLKGYNSTASSLAPDQYTGTSNGSGVDLLQYDSALVTIATGAFGGTTPTASAKVQESDVLGSGYTDVADANLDGVTGNTSGFALAASAVKQIGYLGSKRYVRVILSAVGGSSPVIRASGNVIRGRVKYPPTP